MTWALIRNEQIQNLISYDGTSAFAPPAGHTLEEVPAAAGIGWRRAGEVWEPPAPPAPPAPPSPYPLPEVTTYRDLLLLCMTQTERLTLRVLETNARAALTGAPDMSQASNQLLAALLDFQDIARSGPVTRTSPEFLAAVDGVMLPLGLFGADVAVAARRAEEFNAGLQPGGLA